MEVYVSGVASSQYRLRALSGTEGLGSLFEYRVSVLAKDANIDASTMLEKPVAITVEMPNNKPLRAFHGIVTEMAPMGVVGRYYEYMLVLRPRLWLSSLNRRHQIFHQKSVKDIINSVLGQAGLTVSWGSTSSSASAPRDYTVQYGESDFHFISRLMEQHGLFYYFEHSKSEHKLVITDRISTLGMVSGFESIPYRESIAGQIEMEAVTRWQPRQGLHSGDVLLGDFDYNKKQITTGTHTQSGGHALTGKNSQQQIYEARTAQGAEGQATPSELDAQATIRTEIEQCLNSLIEGEGHVRALTVGKRFKLAEHPRKAENREVAVTATSITMGFSDQESNESEAAFFNCSFTAIPAQVPFRSPLRTPRPTITGPQTAIVTQGAPDGAPDQFGRVKVKFAWASDAESCWIRVASPWAGAGWGMVSHPHVNQEVVVEFLNGEPDRPLITGQVYNGVDAVPYKLPDTSQAMVLRSRSGNQMRLEDNQGAELIRTDAKRDYTLVVANNLAESVGKDAEVTVGANQVQTIGSKYALTVGADMSQTVGGDLDVSSATNTSLAAGTEFGIDAGTDLAANAGTSASLNAGTMIDIKAGVNINLEAGVQITLKTGASTVVIGPMGVIIQGPMVMINSGGGGGSASPKKPAKPKKASKTQSIKDGLSDKKN